MKLRKRITVKDILKFDGKTIPVRIYIEHRANVKATLRDTGLHIRLPAHLDANEKKEQVENYKEWAIAKLRKNPDIPAIKPVREYKDGDVLLVGNDEYKLSIRYIEGNRSLAMTEGNTIHIVICTNQPEFYQRKSISTLLSKCIANQRLPALQKKIRELNKKYFNVKINRISFRHTKTRWGSCSAKGNINISTRLIFAPEDVIEYVCIHEIAHLIVPKHPPQFRAIVEKAMPDYRDKIRWLKENGDLCRY